tara:strand:- start:1175 stop:1324 length:150 start_codon:yes stop_codon:yes gene_type:complete
MPQQLSPLPGAEAALVGGKLYIICFTAPAITFFERDRARAEAIMASAKL